MAGDKKVTALLDTSTQSNCVMVKPANVSEMATLSV